MASIKKTGENAYQIVVSCGYNSIGKKIRRKITYKPELLTAKGNPKSAASIEKDVAAFAADFERKVLTGQYTDGHIMTFEKYAAKYLAEYAEENQAPRTLQSTESAIKEFISAFGYMTLENLTPLYLQEYVNALLKRKKADGSGETLSCGTVKRKAAVLSAMLSQAIRWNLLSANPMERVQIKAPDTPEDEKIVFFSQPEAERFLEDLENPAYYTASGRLARPLDTPAQRLDDLRANRRSMTQYKFLFYLAIFTGCRRGELVALTWDDLDFTNATISIVKSVCRVKKKIIIKSTKTKKSARTISLPEIVISLAQEWKKEQAYYRLSIGSQWKNGGYIFTRWNGEMMGLETPYQILHRVINNYNATQTDESALLPLIPLHGLRHTAATLLIGSNVNIRTVASRLGHSDVTTTLNIYSHALKELDRKASDALVDTLSKKANTKNSVPE